MKKTLRVRKSKTVSLVKRVFFGLAIVQLISCDSAPDVVLVRNHGPAQGSTYNISYVATPGVDFRKQIDSILFEVDKSMSLWDKQSTISKLNRGEEILNDPLFEQVFRRSRQIWKDTEGAFDITVAPLVNYWGFGPEGHGDFDSTSVDSLRNFVGFLRLGSSLDSNRLPKGMQLDMNAIAQGFTVDLIAEYLLSKGITNYLVEVGGELRTSGRNIENELWTIGVDKPQENLDVENRFQVILELDSMALATSGNYRKFWVDEKTGMKYVHTIDPKSGYPIRTRLLSATIIAETAIDADAYATACMVLGLENAKKLINENRRLEAYFVFSDLEGNWEVWETQGFKEMTL